MKKDILTLTAAGALIAMLCSACEYETLPTYTGKQQVYFAYAGETMKDKIVDSLFVAFGYDLEIKQESLIYIGVKVMGKLADYDRPVRCIVVDTASTAREGQDVEFIADSSFVPAGKNSGQIVIRLRNTEYLNGKRLKAALRLVPNEHFYTDYTSTRNTSINSAGSIVATQYKVYFDNDNAIPNLFVAYQTMFYQAFGDYSDKKLNKVCELFGLTRDNFTYHPPKSAEQLLNELGGTSTFLAWGRGLNYWLRQYKADHDGEPFREDDGTEMTGSSLSYLN
jgi:hypothetical protein